MKIVDAATVAAPEIGSSVAADTYPTYVSGKALQWHSRSNADQYGTIECGNISTGVLHFSVDLNFGGYNKTNAPYVQFVDGDGNNILKLGFKCQSATKEYFQYTINDGAATNDGTVASSKLRDKYTGHSIKDVTIDLKTGAVSWTVDCITEEGVRSCITTTKDATIGTGKTIAKIRIGRDFITSSQDHYIWADNISCYVVDLLNPYDYTVKAVDGNDVELQTIASGSSTKAVSVYYPLVIKKADKFYKLQNSSSYVVEVSSSAPDAKVVYIEDNNIMGFEDVGSGTDATYSNGGIGVSTAKLATATLAPGIYTAEIKVVSKAGSGSNHRTEGLFVGGTKITSTNNYDKLFSFNFPVSQANTEAYVRGLGSGNYSDNLDYVLIRKIGELPNAGDDVTSAIINPGFESATNNKQTVLDGWANNGMQVQNNTSFAKEGTYYCEKYVSSGSLPDASISQTIRNLPNGLYKLSAKGSFGGSGAYIKANDAETAVTTAGIYSVMGLVTDGTLTISAGVKNSTSNWLCFDAFSLQFIGGSVSATLNSDGYATFSAATPMQITGAKAYKGAISGTSLVLTEIADGLVPAGTGVVLAGEAGAIATASVVASAPAVEDNDIQATTKDDGSLQAKVTNACALEGNVFKTFDGAAFIANKAYIVVAPGAKLSMVFADDVTAATAVTEQAAKVAPVKYINAKGQIVIGNYNVAGQMIK